MTARWPDNLRWALRLAIMVCASVALGMLLSVAAYTDKLSLLLACVSSVVALVILFLVPIRFLPGITLLVTLLVPTEVAFLPHELQGAAIGIIPFAVWVFRAPSSPYPGAGLRILAVIVGSWLIVSAIVSPLHTHKGLEWLVTVGLALVFAIISAPVGLNARAFRLLFVNVVSAVGLYAVLEGFVIHRNILFARLFEHAPWWVSQHYNASYRVTTLFGHPLINGLVFATAGVLAASELVRAPQRRLWAWARFAILVGATDATHSRGAAIALATGVLVVLVFARGQGQASPRRRLWLFLSLVAAGALLAYGLSARNASREGQQSAQIRETVITRAAEATQLAGPFGAGPGESEAYRRTQRLPGWQMDLENSYAQLAVSLGLIGLVLIVTVLLAVVAAGIRNPAVVGEAAALLTLLVDIASFNAIEGHPEVGLIIALLVVAIVTSPRAVERSARGALSVGAA